jgi:hypothetical protein
VEEAGPIRAALWGGGSRLEDLEARCDVVVDSVGSGAGPAFFSGYCDSEI